MSSNHSNAETSGVNGQTPGPSPAFHSGQPANLPMFKQAGDEELLNQPLLNGHQAVFVVYGPDRQIHFASRIELHAPQAADAPADDLARELASSAASGLYLPILEQVFATGLPQHGQIRLDSGERRLGVSYLPVMDQAGQVAHVVGLAHDLTRYEQVGLALVEKEQRLRLAAEAAGIGIWDYDAAQDRLICDDKFATLLGLEKSPPTSWQAMIQRVHPEDGDWVRRELSEAVQGGKELRLEFRVIWADQSVHWVQVQGRLKRELPSKVRHLMGIALDTTERRKLEESLKDLSGELARSNKDLEDFAYSVSHDLQEPLRMVKGYLQLISRRFGSLIPPEGQEFMEIAVDGAARMQRMISDLLAYSRVHTRGQQPKPTDCNQVLAEALLNLRAIIDKTRAVITSQALPTVLGDKSQLVRLFQNILSNALKFCHAGAPIIDVTVEAEDGSWEFAVSDNGIGMQARDFDRIFQVFQRLHTRGAYPGTGIGLAICKRIVERHGGRIWVQSEPDKGSVFRFTLKGVG